MDHYDHRPRFNVTSRSRSADGEGVVCCTEVEVCVVRTYAASRESTAPVSWFAIPAGKLLDAERLCGESMPIELLKASV